MADNGFISRFRKAVNVFLSPEQEYAKLEYGSSYPSRPDRRRLRYDTNKSVVSPIMNRIAIDAAKVNFRHVYVDENDRYESDIVSGLDYCISQEANLDQTAREFFQDAVISLLDEGVVALVPIDTTANPQVSGSWDILSMRTGKIITWYPYHVKVYIYDEREGKHKEIVLEKRQVAIVENPLFSVMNEESSTLKRLIRKLNLLDVIDEQSASGKLDLIIQLPYTIRTPARKEQAIERREDLETQLRDTKYGIGYIDATEKITQLNRPVGNNLLEQVTYLTKMLYSQLGVTEGVLDGTASEETMLNYYNSSVGPIVTALSENMARKFLTKTARTRGQRLVYFRDPFGGVTTTKFAEISDTFSRNAVISANEVRSVIGYKPDANPKSDVLENKNINKADGPKDPIPEEGVKYDPKD